MLNDLYDYFLSAPHRLISLGQALQITGFGLVVFGLVAHVVTTAASVAPVGAHAPQTLATVFPGLWTWWVPESMATGALALLLAGLGLVLDQTGRRVQRLYGLD